MKGAPSALVVCVWRGRGHRSQRSGNLVGLSISIYSVGHQCIRWGGDTLFRGIGHRAPWGRAPLLHCWGVGCGASCERYRARGVISVTSDLKPGDILDTAGVLVLVLFQIHQVKGGTPRHQYSSIVRTRCIGRAPGIDIMKVVST